LSLSIAVLAAIALAATPPLEQGPGCIAAITAIPMGQVSSGQVVTLTDGSIISPTTHFVSRMWSFGDGDSATSTQASQATVTHEYVNVSNQTRVFVVRLVERAAAGTCATSLKIEVAPAP
jgi:hypothetical protein